MITTIPTITTALREAPQAQVTVAAARVQALILPVLIAVEAAVAVALPAAAAEDGTNSYRLSGRASAA